ncbi:hypothetical protein BCR36DRAFT_415264 [Piromyces finnis]|uniref:Uncharacterized protein n=1 Tax=Piromyces finnis TaxID=1754191 RepID=A0A1Y1UZ65_9FUNG|nr:hypothetical protein BCR36DRAFT_415264 [Piromyces finnis]|eukprot:ORX43894.1 hypothetical protein BCR36DRAFT_415264 [Piromyces finnis]
MGFFDKCLCCFCLSKEESVKVATLSMIIIEILYSIFQLSVKNLVSFVFSILSIALIISLVLFIIGIKNDNTKYINQFKTFSGTILAIQVILLIKSIINSTMEYSSATDIEKIEEIKIDMENNNANMDISNENIISLIRTIALGSIILSIVFILIDIDYYISTTYYIKELLQIIDSKNMAMMKEESIQMMNNLSSNISNSNNLSFCYSNN